MSQPVTISIITVVYNASKDLEQTIRNVAAQTYPNIEYIVIDGGSTDGTLDVIAANQQHITKHISEPDKGLYDAMNKGMQLATGDYIWFMNAGDFIESPNTLQQIADRFNWQHDIYYGETHLIDSNNQILGTRSALTTRKLPTQLTWKSFRHGQVVSHQAIIVKHSLAEPYNLNYPCGADIDWQIRVCQKAISIANTELVLCKFLLGGVSSQRKRSCWQERFAIFRHYYGLPAALAWHAYFVLRAVKFKVLG